MAIQDLFQVCSLKGKTVYVCVYVITEQTVGDCDYDYGDGPSNGVVVSPPMTAVE